MDMVSWLKSSYLENSTGYPTRYSTYSISYVLYCYIFQRAALAMACRIRVWLLVLRLNLNLKYFLALPTDRTLS